MANARRETMPLSSCCAALKAVASDRKDFIRSRFALARNTDAPAEGMILVGRLDVGDEIVGRFRVGRERFASARCLLSQVGRLLVLFGPQSGATG